MRTELTERLGISVPVLGAPMGGVAHGRSARAVTEGGGLGMGLASVAPTALT